VIANEMRALLENWSPLSRVEKARAEIRAAAEEGGPEAKAALQKVEAALDALRTALVKSPKMQGSWFAGK
jgi:hypothetical protein